MIGVAVPSILDVADKELVLRVLGPSRQGQIVRLKSKKCTIGSGARCTLRLRARGVRPLHCLVLRGDAGTVIRRFAPDTRLNGRTFTDAELVPGDQLSVGPLEFEVLEPGASTQVRLDQPQESATEPQEEEWDRRRIELDDLAAKLRRSEEGLDERERSVRQRDAELNQRAEQIDRARADLEAERRGFEDQRRAWDADRAASESQASGESEQLEARLAELTDRREALEQDIQRHQSERAETDRQSTERTSELEAHLAELTARREALEQDIQRYQSEKAETDRQFSERTSELEARQTALDARQSELDARQADLDARESEIDRSRRQMEIEDRPAEADTRSEPEPEGPDEEPDVRLDEPTEGAPESSEEVLVRMGLAPSVNADEADEPPPSPSGPTERDRCESVNPPAKSGEGQDESIDDYMSRLLDRVRETTGQPNPPMPPRSPEETAIDEPPPTAPAEEPDDLARCALPPAATAREAAEPSPRATAPEKSVDMAAMRELANFSARTAIDRHARRVLFGSVVGRLLVALVGLVAGTILTWIWWSNPANITALYAAAVSFVVTLLWGVEYILLRGYGVLRPPDPLKWNDEAEEHAASDLQPEQDAEESL